MSVLGGSVLIYVVQISRTLQGQRRKGHYDLDG